MFNRLNLKKRIFAFLAAVSGCLLLASAIFVFSPSAAAEETLYDTLMASKSLEVMSSNVTDANVQSFTKEQALNLITRASALYYSLSDPTPEQGQKHLELLRKYYNHSELVAERKAETDDTNYQTLTQTSGSLAAGKYRLDADLQLTGKLIINSQVEVTIDLNGYAIIAANKNCVIELASSTKHAKLVIVDTNPVREGHYFQRVNNGPWKLLTDVTNKTGYFMIPGGILTGGYNTTTSGGNCGGAISTGAGNQNSYDGITTFKGGTIVGNYSARGGGAAYGGKFVMQKGAIVGNYANKFSGAIAVSGILEVSNGLIIDNNMNPNSTDSYAKDEKGNFLDMIITTGEGSVFRFSGGEIFGNVRTVAASSNPKFSKTGGTLYGDYYLMNRTEAEFSGGAVYGRVYMQQGSCKITGDAVISNPNPNPNKSGAIQIAGTADFIMDGGVIFDSKAETYGGAIYLASAEGSTCEISGGLINNCSAGDNGGAIYIQSGTMVISGGEIRDNSATNGGGAIYMGGGTLTVNGGMITNNTAQDGGAAYLKSGSVTVLDGTLSNNKATANGGAIYVSEGNFNMSGGTIHNNSATQAGGAVAVNGGNFEMRGGEITGNTSGQNGGGVSLTNGNFTMTKGDITGNTATGGDGGAIYISTSSNSTILIRSGRISNNIAGKSGGALGVYGQGGVVLSIQIGYNVGHIAPVDGEEQKHTCEGNDEICPVIKNNQSGVSGGGIYLSGSYDAKLLMYCIVEADNQVGDGTSPSNFMKVEGGTLVVSTRGENNELPNGSGYIVINGSVHVTGGKVTLMGLGDNPKFEDRITVDIEGTESFFKDLRDKSGGTAYTVQYFENFIENGVKSGQYISMDVKKDTEHTVQAGLYSHDGFLLKAWTLMETIADGTHEPVVPPKEYVGNDKITVTQDIILYAKWEAAGYSIIFLPGVDSYGGAMNQLDLSYTQVANLTPNAFTNVGYNFTNWKREDTGEIYADKQLVSKLTDVDGAEIKLIAQWTICPHTDFEAYSLSSTTDSISRECNCLGYTETATLEGFTVTYDGAEHRVKLTCSAQSKNGEKPSTGVWTESTFNVSYEGQNWDNIVFNDPVVPLKAGNYTATISYPTLNPVVFASVNVIINKKDQLPPPVPQYDTEEIDSKMVIKVKDAYQERLEYTFTWYDEDTNQYESNLVRWTNQSITPFQQLDKIYTNYYVSVKFVGDDNHNPSVDVKGTWVVVYTGGVSFSFSADAGMLCQDAAGEADSGLVVTLTPQPGYYIYNVQISQMSSSKGSEYELPKYEHTLTLRDQWKVRFFDIKTLTDKDTVNIYVHFTGAELIPTIEADTVKDQVFSSIYNKGETNVTISKDSAYTVRFDVDNYKHYSNPVISFSTALPSETRLVMMDQSDSSYWGYTVGASPVSSVLLSDFVRMGSTEKFAVANNRTSLDLQFVVDFSRCATPLDPTTLTAKFYATPIHPLQSIQTVPSLPSEGDAVSKVTLVEILQFTINEDVGTFDDPEVENIAYKYAFSAENIGISKWQSRKGVLVITPSETLPADARLQVTIGNSTNIYGLKDGRYIVALPSGNSGEVSITFLSDMVPVGQQTYNFSVEFYASETLVGSTPESEFDSPAKSISYTVTKSAPIELKAQITSTSSLPQFIPRDENGKPSITSLGYSVSTSVLPSGYSVKATLYGKNPDGKGYSATTQSSTLDFSEGTEFTLELASLAEGMTTKLGSLSMMLRIEVLDSNGKVVTYYPLYFIVVDPR